jgi:hypothetical protein
MCCRCVVLIAVWVALSACAPTVVPPEPLPQDQTTRTFDRSFDQVWTLVVDWFAESNIPIRQIERASGLIASEHRLGADDHFLNCGALEDRRFELTGRLGKCSNPWKNRVYRRGAGEAAHP